MEVAILMGGGLATYHGAQAMTALEEAEESTAPA